MKSNQNQNVIDCFCLTDSLFSTYQQEDHQTPTWFENRYKDDW